MQARYYDPVIGRFYSNDPIGTIEHLGTHNGIHAFNRFAYANNNPYKFTDPTGMSNEKVVEKVTSIAKKSPQAQVAVTSVAIASSIAIQANSTTQNPSKVMETIVKTNPVTSALTSIPGVGEVLEKGLDDMLNPADSNDMSSEQIQEGGFDGRIRVSDMEAFIDKAKSTESEGASEKSKAKESEN